MEQLERQTSKVRWQLVYGHEHGRSEQMKRMIDRMLPSLFFLAMPSYIRQ
jgi:hypothetical protein